MGSFVSRAEAQMQRDNKGNKPYGLLKMKIIYPIRPGYFLNDLRMFVARIIKW